MKLYTLLLIVFVGFIGISIAYPLFPPLFLNADSPMMATWSLNARSLLLGVTLAAYPLGQFIGAPIIGAVSDRYGRRKILLISLLGTLLGYLLTALALQWHSLALLVTSRLLTGLFESSLALAQAIIADMKDINKHKGFGSVIMAASIGYMVGPLLGGFLSGPVLLPSLSLAVPFYVAALLAALTVLLAYKTLPETSMRRHTASGSLWRQFNLLGHLQGLLQNQTVKCLLFSSLLFTLGVDLFYEFGPVFLTAQFNLRAPQIAVYNVVLSAAIALGGIWLPQLLSRQLKPSKTMGILLFIFGLLLFLIAILPFKPLLFLLFALIGLIIPAAGTLLNVELSNAAGDAIQGKVMGMQWGLRMLGDALICLFGGVLIICSAALPLFLGVAASFIAIIVYFSSFKPIPIQK